MINPRFTATFLRIIFEVVNSAPGTIPAYLKPCFGPAGWTCTNAIAKKDLQHYGFLVLSASRCGNAH